MEKGPRIPTVVLGGGTLKGRTEPKASLIVCDEPLIQPALRAVTELSDRVGPMTVVTDLGLAHQYRINNIARVVPPGNSLIESVRAGIAGMDQDKPTLLVCGDMSLVTSDMIDRFLELSEKRSTLADAWLPYIRRETAEQALPGFSHTYGRLAEGQFCMAGLTLLRPKVLRSKFVELLAEGRKGIGKLLLLLGLPTIGRFLLGRLRIPDLETVLSDRLKFKVVGVELPDGALSVDVDSRAKLAAVRRYLETKRLKSQIDSH